MSAAFVCFFAPEKRLARLVEELSRERRSAKPLVNIERDVGKT
jgi:hypothetical protein